MPPPPAAPAKPRGKFRTVVATILVVCVVIVAIQNWAEAKVQILVIEVRMPLLALIAVSFGIGVLVGWLTRKRRRG